MQVLDISRYNHIKAMQNASPKVLEGSYALYNYNTIVIEESKGSNKHTADSNVLLEYVGGTISETLTAVKVQISEDNVCNILPTPVSYFTPKKIKAH